MTESGDYRSKLRTPNKGKVEVAAWVNSSPLEDFGDFPNYLSTPSPIKRMLYSATDTQSTQSPHKSGYLLRTPSPPQKSSIFSSPSKSNIKVECKGTPSPYKASSNTDLFGNRSLLENLPIPEWDDNFLDDFQEGLFGLGNDDLEGLVRSPGKSPRRSQPYFTNSPFKKSSPGAIPFKTPLLTSSPKFPIESPGESSLLKTPGVIGGRPLTRQRKLFLQSPERQVPSTSTSSWPTPLPFSSFDDTASSMFSDMENETAGSSQNISSYIKQMDCETNDDYSVMPPIGWTLSENPPSKSSEKLNHKGKGKSLKQKHSSNSSHNGLSSSTSSSSGSKKVKVEPQFTLLRPHTEFHSSQICLRMTPRTPPNKMKISRDFSQIQTLPSKERLRIVRNRFRESLDRAVEQAIEKEKKLKEQCMSTGKPVVQCFVQKPLLALQPAPVSNLISNFNVHCPTRLQPIKKKKR